MGHPESSTDVGLGVSVFSLVLCKTTRATPAACHTMEWGASRGLGPMTPVLVQDQSPGGWSHRVTPLP